MKREDAQARANMLLDFIQSPAWTWLKTTLEMNLAHLQQELEMSDGNTFARLQGAARAYRVVLSLPPNSLEGYRKIASGETEEPEDLKENAE